MLRPGLLAVRRNWRGMLLIQSLAAVAVGVYYLVPQAQPAFERLSALRAAWGVFYGIAAAAVAGTVLPEVARALTQPGWRLRGRGGELFFNLCFFSYVGALVHYFYWGLGRLVGDGNDLQTIATKVAIDMLLFTPFYALPVGLAIFDWRLSGYRLGPVVRSLGPRWYRDRVLPLLVPNVCFWLPMVCLIYSLPGPLQLVLWSLAMAAWSLVLVFIGTRQT